MAAMMTPGSPVRLVPGPRRRSSNLVILLLVIIALLWSLVFHQNIGRGLHVTLDDIRDPLDAIVNNTLGFEKIFAISPAQRLDRRDAVVLASSATGFHVDFIDGLILDEDSAKELNDSKDSETVSVSRPHANAVQRIVADGIASALILEDDVDWDINLKMQLKGLALGSQQIPKINAPERNATTDSPYGDSWDVLWIGHCGMKCNSSSPVQVMPHDITAMPSRYLPPYLYDAPAGTGNNVRMTCIIEKAACSAAYAITYGASQKILAALTRLTDADNLDFPDLLSELCDNGSLECYSSYPSLVGRWKRGRREEYSSDNDQEAVDRQMSHSSGVMYSTLGNIEHILGGECTVRASIDDAIVPELNPDLFEVPHSFLQWTDKKGGHERAL
ncbi:Ankyrin repeats (3 copies) family protein [Aspergillus niger]|uniref:Ankyrin repeats (3 copies) family protein n=1 Tax=Aspergillus niger TaxID=5061 RepID=A0A254TYZ6_ASPNG|nr:Ankyrin repeats (3 copies) family protein [Aspergillus niger]SPB44616.1 unnamed protein product [Aspergillus niger]